MSLVIAAAIAAALGAVIGVLAALYWIFFK